MKRQNTNIAGFLGFSMLLHVLLLWSWQQPAVVPLLPLGQIEVQIRQAVTGSTGGNATHRLNADKRMPIPNRNSVPPSSAAARIKPSHSPQAGQTAEDSLHVQLQGKIRTALSRYLTYPVRARHQGWQGTVTVRLVVQANGNLADIALVHSSGFTELDDSAISALKNVHRLDELIPLLDGEHVTLELPITYKLSG